MELKPDDDDSFEFIVSNDNFTEGEKDALFSNPLDDPDLHRRCKYPELCNEEQCMVYIVGSELATIQDSGDSFDDIISDLDG